jgi:peptidoglycan/xylan/chitin deacetylase (PgdA/CDA1 family)
MDWQEIDALYKGGNDIESHTMNHRDLSKMSSQMLNYEIGQSKQCLLDHGINASIFAYPFAKGSDNSTVVNVVAKYYDLARTGFSPVSFLKCDGWKQNSSQVDCRTYFDNGTLTFANRYSIRGWMHERIVGGNYTSSTNYHGSNNYGYNNDKIIKYYINYSHDNYQTLSNFIKVVNSQENYNKGGRINAIPIITYHNIVNDTVPYAKNPLITTDIGLFKEEMKYLHDNGFRVITLNNIGYDQSTKYLYIK